jgi:hypothetical protein
MSSRLTAAAEHEQTTGSVVSAYALKSSGQMAAVSDAEDGGAYGVELVWPVADSLVCACDASAHRAMTAIVTTTLSTGHPMVASGRRVGADRVAGVTGRSRVVVGRTNWAAALPG